MARVRSVMTAAHGAEMADTAVKVKDGPRIGLKRSGQERCQIEVVHFKVDVFVEFERAGRVVDVDEP